MCLGTPTHSVATLLGDNGIQPPCPVFPEAVNGGINVIPSLSAFISGALSPAFGVHLAVNRLRLDHKRGLGGQGGGYAEFTGLRSFPCFRRVCGYLSGPSFVSEVDGMVVQRGWSEEEEGALREAYERVDARVTAFEFWNDVYLIFSGRFPNRTRTALQQHGLIIGMRSKRTDTHDIICIGCDKVGVHNRKRGLCLRCYGRVRY